MPPQRLQSNDDSFATFAFAVVSVIGIIVFFPVVTGLLRALWRRLTGKASSASTATTTTSDAEGKKAQQAKAYTDEPEILPGTEDFKTAVAALSGAVKNPGLIAPILRSCKAHADITRALLPRLVRFMLRPKIFLVVMWVSLFSTVLYSNLTYDPYAALGLTSAASESEVKKAYRSITKLNHPDRNKTAEAKVIFVQARKAYKAISDPEAFEKEVGNSDEFVAGIALPSFMMSGEHDGLTLILLFSLLFGLPVYIYRSFGRGLQERLLECLGILERNNAFIDVLLAELGIPEDPALLERRRQRTLMHRALTAAGILPPTAPESAVDGLPPYKEFRAKVLAGERQRQQLAQQFRFEPAAVQALRQYFDAQTPEERAADEAPIQRRPNAQPLPNKAEIHARAFLIRRLFDANKATLEDFATHVGTGQLSTIQRLLQGQEGASAALDDLIATSEAHAAAYAIAAAGAAGGKEAAEAVAAKNPPKPEQLQVSARARSYLVELPRRYEEGLNLVRQETTAYLQHRAERKQREAEAAAAAGN